VAEGARLESVYTGNRIVGSNPTLSASIRSQLFAPVLKSSSTALIGIGPSFRWVLNSLGHGAAMARATLAAAMPPSGASMTTARTRIIASRSVLRARGKPMNYAAA
jgi:hypothetical protein